MSAVEGQLGVDRRGHGRLAPAQPALTAFACVTLAYLVTRAAWDAHLPMGPVGAWVGAALGALAWAQAAGGARSRWRGLALALAAALLAGAWFRLAVIAPGAGALAQAIESRDAGAPPLVEIEGVVVEGGRDRTPTGALAQFVPFAGAQHTAVVRVERLSGSPLEGDGADRLRLTIGGRAPAGGLIPGERVRALGFAEPMAPPRNPGEREGRLRAWASGLAGDVRTESWGVVERLGMSEAPIDRLRAWQWRMQTRARAMLEGDGPGRALLGEILLGVRDASDADAETMRGAFRRVGLAHLLAISGFHLVALAGMVALIGRVTPWGAGSLGLRLTALAVVLVIALYVVLLPARPPVLRASAMILAWYAARALGRRYHPLALLAWTGVALLLVRPTDLWDAGFQLTLLMTAALIACTTRAHARLWGLIELRRLLRGARALEDEPLPRAVRGWFMGRARALATASVLCWSVALPIAAERFGIVSPAAVLATLVVVPLLVPLLWAGYLAVLLGLLAPGLGAWASGMLAWAGGGVATLVGWIDALPASSVRVPTLSSWWSACAVAALLWAWAGPWTRASTPGARRVLALAPLAGALLWAGAEAQWRARLAPGVALRADALAVGDGTAILVRAPGRGAMLWDAGALSPGVGRRLIPEACRALGAWRVPTVVLSHPNFDHYSGLLDAADPLGVRRVVVGPAFIERAAARPAGPAAALLEALRARGIEIIETRAGEVFTLGGATLEFLAPDPALDTPDAATNDRSLIALVRAPGAPALLLTGDIQHAGIASFMAGRDTGALGVGVMEAPHHGSFNAEAERLVGAVDPRAVLQSTGPRRARDARWSAQRAQRAWLVTAEVGAAWAEIRRDGVVRAGSSLGGPGADVSPPGPAR